MNTAGFSSWDIRLIPDHISIGGRWFDCAIIAEAGPWVRSASADSSEMLTGSDGQNTIVRNLPPANFPRIIDRHILTASYLIISKEDYIHMLRMRAINQPISVWVGGYVADSFDCSEGDTIKLSRFVATDTLAGPDISTSKFPTLTYLDDALSDSAISLSGRDGIVLASGRVEVIYSPLYSVKFGGETHSVNGLNNLIVSVEFQEAVSA